MDTVFLKTLTEAPSIGTACGPVMNLLTRRFGDDWTRASMSDGFCLFQKTGASREQLKAVFVAHMDEVGGCVYGPRSEAEGGGFQTRWWGNEPGIFANADLQAFDYLAQESSETFPVRGELADVAGETRLILHGEGIRPYRTGWTFREETTFNGDIIEGKALDPRVTLFAVAEAVRELNSPEIGVVFVMAEECAMDVARKAVDVLAASCPELAAYRECRCSRHSKHWRRAA